MYDAEVSHSTLNEITERIIPMMKECQCRPLELMYPIVWLDAMHCKVKSGGVRDQLGSLNSAAISREERKNLIGMYISESEGVCFRLSVLTDLKAKGVNDILIVCIDNLTGFAEAITTVFPLVEIQSCIVHQIWDSLK